MHVFKMHYCHLLKNKVIVYPEYMIPWVLALKQNKQTKKITKRMVGSSRPDTPFQFFSKVQNTILSHSVLNSSTRN